jgi:hypothetical protein
MTKTYFAASCNLKRFAFVYLFKRGRASAAEAARRQLSAAA